MEFNFLSEFSAGLAICQPCVWYTDVNSDSVIEASYAPSGFTGCWIIERSRMVGLFLSWVFTPLFLLLSLGSLWAPMALRYAWAAENGESNPLGFCFEWLISYVRLSALWKQCYKRAGPAQSLRTVHRNDEIQIFTCLYRGFTDGGWCFGVVLAYPSGSGSMHHGSPQVKDANSFADLL